MPRADSGDPPQLQPEREFVINGRRVTLKERLPLRVAPKLPQLLEEAGRDLRAVSRIGVLLVEEWDFEGVPSDPRAWEELDITTEILPLAVRLGEYINRRLEYAGGKV